MLQQFWNMRELHGKAHPDEKLAIHLFYGMIRDTEPLLVAPWGSLGVCKTRLLTILLVVAWGFSRIIESKPSSSSVGKNSQVGICRCPFWDI
jgi:hypothetical protein